MSEERCMNVYCIWMQPFNCHLGKYMEWHDKLIVSFVTPWGGGGGGPICIQISSVLVRTKTETWTSEMETHWSETETWDHKESRWRPTKRGLETYNKGSWDLQHCKYVLHIFAECNAVSNKRKCAARLTQHWNPSARTMAHWFSTVSIISKYSCILLDLENCEWK